MKQQVNSTTVTLTGNVSRVHDGPPSERHMVSVAGKSAHGASVGEARTLLAQRIVADLAGMGEPMAMATDGDGATWLFVPLGSDTAVYRSLPATDVRLGPTLRAVGSSEGTPAQVMARWMAEGALTAPMVGVVAS